MTLELELASRAGISLCHSGWLEPGSIYFEWAKNLPTALVTAVIGFLAFWVANRQKRIAESQAILAEEKIRLELFEERYALFVELQTYFLNFPAVEGHSEHLATIFALNAAADKAGFLFDSEIKAVFERAGTKGSELFRWKRQLTQRRSELDPNIHEQAERGIEECEQWFLSERKTLAAKFAKYLAFGHLTGGIAVRSK